MRNGFPTKVGLVGGGEGSAILVGDWLVILRNVCRGRRELIGEWLQGRSRVGQTLRRDGVKQSV